jgi:LEA14-like dessication related protein
MALCWIFLAVAMLGCSKPKPVSVTPKTLSVTSVSPAGLQLAVTLDVSNPNGFPIRAQSVTGTISANGIEVGQGTATPTATIPAESSAEVPATVTASWTGLTALAPLAFAGGPVPFEFRGVARLGGESLNVDVPFALKGELTRDQILRAGLRGMP